MIPRPTKWRRLLLQYMCNNVTVDRNWHAESYWTDYYSTVKLIEVIAWFFQSLMRPLTPLTIKSYSWIYPVWGLNQASQIRSCWLSTHFSIAISKPHYIRWGSSRISSESIIISYFNWLCSQRKKPNYLSWWLTSVSWSKIYGPLINSNRRCCYTSGRMVQWKRINLDLSQK